MRTIDEVRVARLELLIAEHGSLQAVAERMGKSHSQMSQLRTMASHSTTGKPRVIGNDLAREFEEKFSKPRGWMDNDPSFDLPESNTPAVDLLDSAQTKVLQDLSDLLPEDAEQFRTAISDLADKMRRHRAVVLKREGLQPRTPNAEENDRSPYSGPDRRSPPGKERQKA